MEYFQNLVTSETEKLTVLADEWQLIGDEECGEMNEDGEIYTSFFLQI